MSSSRDSIHLVGSIAVYAYPFIALAAIITNVLSFIVFSRRKFHNTVFSVYYRFAIVLMLAAAIIPLNKFVEFNLNIHIRNFNDSLCKLRMYLFYIVYPTWAWILVAISIDRFLSIAFASRFLFRKKRAFQITVCCLIFVYNLIFYIPLLFYFIETKEERANSSSTNLSSPSIKITKRCTNKAYPTDWLNIFNSTLIPFIFMFTFTLLTSRSIFKLRKRGLSISSSKIRQRDVRFAITSIGLSIMFLMFNLPESIRILLTLFINFESQLNKSIVSVIYLSFYSSLSSVFFTNLAFNSLFRNELFILLGLERKTKVRELYNSQID